MKSISHCFSLLLLNRTSFFAKYFGYFSSYDIYSCLLVFQMIAYQPEKKKVIYYDVVKHKKEYKNIYISLKVSCLLFGVSFSKKAQFFNIKEIHENLQQKLNNLSREVRWICNLHTYVSRQHNITYTSNIHLDIEKVFYFLLKMKIIIKNKKVKMIVVDFGIKSRIIEIQKIKFHKILHLLFDCI